MNQSLRQKSGLYFGILLLFPQCCKYRSKWIYEQLFLGGGVIVALHLSASYRSFTQVAARSPLSLQRSLVIAYYGSDLNKGFWRDVSLLLFKHLALLQLTKHSF